MWLQRDWGDGPRIGGWKTQLFSAWLAWSRFRVVIPAWDQQLGTLTWCLDQALRQARSVIASSRLNLPARRPARRCAPLTLTSGRKEDQVGQWASDRTPRTSRRLGVRQGRSWLPR